MYCTIEQNEKRHEIVRRVERICSKIDTALKALDASDLIWECGCQCEVMGPRLVMTDAKHELEQAMADLDELFAGNT